MRLIDPNVIIHRGSVAEEDLKRRLAHEAMEQAGCLDAEGKALKGVTWTVLRGRQPRGGYTVEITRDLRLSDQARLMKPEGV